jgi:hypothetical protein
MYKSWCKSQTGSHFAFVFVVVGVDAVVAISIID